MGMELKTTFWEDMCLGDKYLVEQFPRLYINNFSKSIAIKLDKTRGWDSIEFRRTLYGNTEQQWSDLKELVNDVELTYEKDTRKWALNNRKTFIVRSILHLEASLLVR